MHRTTSRFVPIVCAFLFLGGTLFAQIPAGGKTEIGPDKGDGATKTKPLTLDDLQLPSKTVVIIVEKFLEAQKIIPDLTAVPTKEYQEMRKRIQELEAKLKRAKLSPHSCRMTAKQNGDALVIEANYIIKTFVSDQTVLLGCRGGQLISADLNGKLPDLNFTLDGFTIDIAKPGKYDLTLRLETAITPRRQPSVAGGTEYSFALGLPGAVYTSFQLTLPAAVKEIQSNGKTKKTSVARRSERVWTLRLGQAENLSVSWVQQPDRVSPVGSATAKWEVSTQLLAYQAVTTAKLILDDLRGKTTRWRLLLPKTAQLEILGDADQEYSTKSDDQTGLVIVTGPAAPHLEFKVTVIQKRPLKKVSVGPFLLLDADRQEAIFEVRAVNEVLRGHHLRYHIKGDLRPQDIPDKNSSRDLEARFQSWDLTEALKLPRNLNSKQIRLIPPHLELELKPITPLVESSVDHALHIGEGENGWRITCLSRIHVTPFKGGVEFIDVRRPGLHNETRQILLTLIGSSAAPFPGNVMDALALPACDAFYPVQISLDHKHGSETAGIVTDLQLLKEQNIARIYLQPVNFKQTTVLKPFTIALVTKYDLPRDMQEVRLQLPRPITIRDKGGSVIVAAEKGLELLHGKPGLTAVPLQRFSTTYTNAPKKVDFAWRSYRPKTSAAVVSDVTYQARHGLVRQEMTFAFPSRPETAPESAAPRKVQLHVPSGIFDLQISGGGKLLGLDPINQSAMVELSTKNTLRLQYYFPLPAPDGQANAKNARSFAAPTPLIRPAQSAQLQMTVRLWSERGLLPTLPAGVPGNELWKDIGAAAALPNKASLPAYTLRAIQPRAPLTVMLPDELRSSQAPLIVDRALVKIWDDNGAKMCRTRFLFSRLQGPYIDVEMPASVRKLRPIIQLNGKEAAWEDLQPGGGAIARVRLEPKWLTERVILDIRYQYVPDETDAWQSWRQLLQAPRFDQDFHVLNGVRWQIYLPSNQTPILVGNYVNAPQQWVWKNWMFMPQAHSSSAELEEWISGEASAVAGGGQPLVVQTGDIRTLQLFLVPRYIWIFLCSGVLLLIGFGLIFQTRMRIVLWLILFALAPALIATSVAAPVAFQSILYGAQLGLAILLAVFLLHVVLRWRYQRQMDHLPGFTRIAPGSIANGSELPLRRAPSTVDAVPPVSKISGVGKEVIS